MKVTIYHNPRCSKSRATLELLNARGVTPEIVDYLATPPAPGDLARLVKLLGQPVTQIIRFNEPEAKRQGLSPHDQRDEAEWLDILAASPQLLQRPIVVVDDRAAIGRPPDKVLAIL